jgi:Raf kinase inhibitor-like YbhB/YbcL family protein
MNRGPLALLFFCGTSCSGCRSGGAQLAPAPGVTLGSLTVTSTSFPSNGGIPVDYTCDGADKSPQLTLSAPPAGTQSLAIVADDPDAPGGTFTHWIAYNLQADLRTFPEGADPLSAGAAVGTNDFNRVGYAGPCPPKRELHHYYFRVFALNALLDLKPNVMRDGFDAAMSGHVLAEGALIGVFSH